VKYIIKPSATSTSLPARDTCFVVPVWIKFFAKTLSKIGSISSPQSSIKSGTPVCKAFSTCVLKYLC